MSNNKMKNSILKSTIFFVLVFFTLAGSASATTYYTSPTGSGNGLSVSTPGDLTTLSSNLQPGDILYLLGGTYSKKTIIPSYSGTAAKHITIKSYDGTPTLLSDYSDAHGLYIDTGIDYLDISGIKVSNYANVVAIGGSHINISNCEFCYAYDDVLWIGGNSGQNNVVLDKCSIHDGAMSGSAGPNMIDIGGVDITNGGSPVSNITIKNCDIYGHALHQAFNIMAYSPGASPSYPPTFSKIGLQYVTIENNSIHDITGTGTGSDGMYTIYGDAHYFTIQNNRFYNLPNRGLAGRFSNSKIINNKFENIRSWAIYFVGIPGSPDIHDTIIANNLIEDNIMRLETVSKMNINNNTAAEYAIYGDSTRTDIKDGICPSTQGSYSVQSIQNEGQVAIVYTNGASFSENGKNSIQTVNGQSILNVNSGETVTVSNVVPNDKPVSATPVASFSTDVTSGYAPLNVAFTDTSTNTPTSWSWDFGDGATATIKSPTHQYSNAGSYTVKLTATNAAGSNTVTKSSYITVTSPTTQAPVASFTATSTSGTAPLNVVFTDTSSNTPTSWSWDFGDGATATVKSPTHQYSKAGSYTVKLTATNAAGSNTVTKSSYITVTSAPQAPVASFTATPTSGTAPLNVVFTDTSTNTPTSWSWDFGDGATATVKSTTHQYSKAGRYTVKLTATNAAGSNTVTKFSYITVTSPTTQPKYIRNKRLFSWH